MHFAMLCTELSCITGTALGLKKNVPCMQTCLKKKRCIGESFLCPCQIHRGDLTSDFVLIISLDLLIF